MSGQGRAVRPVRGYGPVSETLMMGRILRQCSKDYAPVFKFIHAETDRQKKSKLWDLYHSYKLFIDQWDGISPEGKQTPEFGRHAHHVWSMMVDQDVGRKLFIVGMCGITSGIDTTYFAFWPTIQGITPAEISMMKYQLGIWKEVANGMAIESEPSSSETDPGRVVSMADGLTTGNAAGTIVNDDDDGSTIIVDGGDSDDPTDGAVVDVEGLDVEAVKEVSKADDSVVTIEPVTSGIGSMEVDADITIATTSDTADAVQVEASQTLPAPNVHIPTIDDQWSDDEFFETAAQRIVTQSTPTNEDDANATNVNGKTNTKTIEIKPEKVEIESARTFKFIDQATECAQQSLFTLFFSRQRRFGSCYSATKIVGNPGTMEVLDRPNLDPNENIVSVTNHRVRPPRLGEIGRQNAVRESPSPRPNPRNCRLLGRRGSRGQRNESENGRSNILGTPAPRNDPTNAAAIEQQQNPTLLAEELRALIARVRDLESRMTEK